MMDNLEDYFLSTNPLSSFLNWYETALKVEQNAQAMAVATYDHIKKRPTSRILLYKGVRDDKIIFYTNYLSSKSKDLDSNLEVALNFYWHVSGRQVRIQGRATKMDAKSSADYFYSRDRDSQIASYISTQSAPIEDKSALVLKFMEAKKKFEGQDIPMPLHWGGYLVDPYEFEFFIYGANRLNDRFVYELNNKKWEVKRLQP